MSMKSHGVHKGTSKALSIQVDTSELQQDYLNVISVQHNLQIHEKNTYHKTLYISPEVFCRCLVLQRILTVYNVHDDAVEVVDVNNPIN